MTSDAIQSILLYDENTSGYPHKQNATPEIIWLKHKDKKEHVKNIKASIIHTANS